MKYIITNNQMNYNECVQKLFNGNTKEYRNVTRQYDLIGIPLDSTIILYEGYDDNPKWDEIQDVLISMDNDYNTYCIQRGTARRKQDHAPYYQRQQR